MLSHNKAYVINAAPYQLYAWVGLQASQEDANCAMGGAPLYAIFRESQPHFLHMG